MKAGYLVSAVIVATSLAVGASAVSAQQRMGPGAQGHYGAGAGPQGRSDGTETSRPYRPHMTQRGMMGQGMMGQGMMGQGMMGSGMAGQGMMGRGMMGPGMMQGGMGPGMMGQGMGAGMMMRGMASQMGFAGGGMASMFGARVVPMLNLSPDDVRAYLAWRLERLGNERLKVGDVKAEGDTITADIVTVDSSLVQRMKVDRHTGVIDYE